jgi:DNA segregation ATPase FtsK/SpoIIIE, S-DNA-T family
MAKNTYKSNTFKEPPKEKKKGEGFKLKWGVFKDPRFHLSVGLFLLVSALFLFTAFVSYLFTGKADQSVMEAVDQLGIMQSAEEAENWLGLYGALFSHYFIFKWFGLSAFFIPPILFLGGYRILFKKELLRLSSSFVFAAFFMVWISLLLGSVVLSSEDITEWGFLSGGMGYHLAVVVHSMLGWGLYMFLIFTFLVFVIFFFNITTLLSSTTAVDETDTLVAENKEEDDQLFPVEDDYQPTYQDDSDTWTLTQEGAESEQLAEIEQREEAPPQSPVHPTTGVAFSIEPSYEEKTIDNSEIPLPEEAEFIIEEEVEEELAGEVENYDPTLDLSSYQYPTLDLLDEHDTGKVKVSIEELDQNKNRIEQTLGHFNIKISSIKATIGPTVTLYEIVPDKGVKISKIKNLEDDIALSLSALGIRIIAPIPGKGTIGIEVPNKNREMVDIRSVLATEKFMKSDKDLPVALGRTISNEVHVVDLAKMPHLLMAGATGQGKSVGLNILLTCLLYKKHPSQLKFVLVDPKKVELTLFTKIERHFLAKLPNSEEAIITDTKKVVHTLNSLCIEMDNRYELLKDAGVRNLKEYNAKFVKRRLNPNEGHRFLPYIVLVIDELADLMMTAGKEIETPIARLAQLARAIGIHLVVATQRPSVNVITGIIKANFPARLSFRVTSKIDSRTILDSGGADQLVGMGDMLLSNGSEVIRLQCAFIDTPEVERVCEFIGAQRGYETAYMLPEFEDEDGGPSEIDLSERDAMFEEAARLIVAHQQGSTSLIQRKLKLGYNRAGRLIDQLEAAGIVGPFEGSKAREVLIRDEYSLEQLLNSLNQN